MLRPNQIGERSFAGKLQGWMTCTAFIKGRERGSFLDSLGGGLYSLSRRLLQTTVTDEAAIAAPATCNSPRPGHS